MYLARSYVENILVKRAKGVTDSELQKLSVRLSCRHNRIGLYKYRKAALRLYGGEEFPAECYPVSWDQWSIFWRRIIQRPLVRGSLECWMHSEEQLDGQR